MFNIPDRIKDALNVERLSEITKGKTVGGINLQNLTQDFFNRSDCARSSRDYSRLQRQNWDHEAYDNDEDEQSHRYNGHNNPNNAQYNNNQCWSNDNNHYNPNNAQHNNNQYWSNNNSHNPNNAQHNNQYWSNNNSHNPNNAQHNNQYWNNNNSHNPNNAQYHNNHYYQNNNEHFNENNWNNRQNYNLSYTEQLVYNSAPRHFGTGVSLIKGQKFNLSSSNSGLDVIKIGLGWDLPTNSRIPYDLDAEAFMLGANNKVIGDEWFIFYNQTISPDGSCVQLCDSTTGQGSGDDEIIQIQLSKVNPQVQKIAIVITINDAVANEQKFGDVRNAYVRVIDKRDEKEIVKFNLTDYACDVRSLTVGEIYRKGNEWRFNAVGQGLDTDLAGLCNFYGVNLF